ncbi:nascent polypeptide-associated complex protein [Halobacteriales archaeon QS_1_68_17]|nr:MAG: nascent polypeptide-associated complex protein [Halobacteriales archaeon QS_1_68_17]
MFGGGGGLNPRKMKQMMEQMGIDIEEIDAEEVVIRTDEEELVFTDADIQRMDAQGQQTYQVIGEPETRERGGADGDRAAADEDGDDEAGDDGIPQSDVDIVVQRTGASEGDAREALEAADGDLAAAIARLE